MMLEHVERRILGAVRPVDVVTGRPLRHRILVEGQGMRFFRNRSGYYVMETAPGLEAHTAAFLEPPSLPGVGSVTVRLTLRDPERRFLPRRSAVDLPLDPEPENAGTPGSLFLPVDIPMIPAPRASTAAGWATLRLSITAQGSNAPLGGALVRVTRVIEGGASRVGLGMSDERGEALVAVSGIPATMSSGEGEGAVLVSEVDAVAQAVFDPLLAVIPDPDDLESRREDLPSVSADVRLASGRELVVPLSVPLPE